MKPKVLVTDPIHQVGWDVLATETEAVAWAGPQAEPLETALEGVQGVIVRVARFRGETIRGMKQLKIIRSTASATTTLMWPRPQPAVWL